MCSLVKGTIGLNCITKGLTNLSSRHFSNGSCYAFTGGGGSYALPTVIRHDVKNNDQLNIFEATLEQTLPANTPSFVFHLIAPGFFEQGFVSMVYKVIYRDGNGNSQILKTSIGRDCNIPPTQEVSKVTFTGLSGQRWEITLTFLLPSNDTIGITNIAFEPL